MAQISVGARIECDHSRGTVKFVGEVDVLPGVWLGIEWDSPGRGKHDGSYNGKRHFSTRNPTAGSFIKPEKVTTGVSFLEGLRERYRKSEGGDIDEKNILDLKKNFNAPFVQVLGMEKIGNVQSDLFNLKQASVSTSLVSYADSDITEVCPNLEEIDLSTTLLASWEDVFSIIKQLPNLKVLNVSYNLLRLSDKTEPQFPSVLHLSMGFMDYTWEDIRSVCRHFPSLEYLQIPGNRVTLINEVDDYFQTLKRIDLENNTLRKWDNLSPLGKLQRLERLNVTRCRLEDIKIKPGDFPSLHILWLTRNELKQWSDISQLGRIGTLTELHVRENPLMEKQSAETNRQCAIARISSLKVLNGTVVESQERRGAEIDYVRHLALVWHKLKDIPSERTKFVEEHPRFEQLAERFGLPSADELEKKPTTIKSSLINVTFVLLGISEPISKKIPVTMQVSKLRSLVARLEGGDNEDACLFVASQKAPEVLIPLDNDMRQLSFYSVGEGDTIYLR